jgi:hypothetical protein
MKKLLGLGVFCLMLGACATGRPTGGGHVVGNGLVPEGTAVSESHGGCSVCAEKKSCGCEKETCSCGGAAKTKKK